MRIDELRDVLFEFIQGYFAGADEGFMQCSGNIRKYFKQKYNNAFNDG